MPALGPAERLARGVLGPYVRLRRGESVVVEAWSSGLDWARPFVLEARRRGAEPTLAVEDEAAFFRSLAELPRPVRPVAPSSLAGVGDAHVYLEGPAAVGRLAGLPLEERRTLLARHGPRFRATARRAGTRFVRLTVSRATARAAAGFGVDLGAWQEELVAASTVPPARLAAHIGALRARLRGARHIRVRHPNGTDVTVELDRRAPIGTDGASFGSSRPFPLELPTGRLVAFVRAGRAEGRWEANRPGTLPELDGRLLLGGRFDLRRGRVEEFEFDRGGEEFAEALADGGRGRDLVGALVFGANPCVVRAPGAAALAVGAVSLWIGETTAIGRPNRSGFSFASTLADAVVEIDGRSSRSSPPARERPGTRGGAGRRNG